jgi:hypothetical protein
MGEIAEDKDLAIERFTPLKDYLPIVFCTSRLFQKLKDLSIHHLRLHNC